MAGAEEYTERFSLERYPSLRVSWYDTQQSDGEVPVMQELWGMRSTSSLSSLPGLLCSGVVASDMTLPMGQIELNCELFLNWIAWNRTVGLGVRVFANGPGDLGSIPGRVIPKTQKMVLDASLLSTQHYKVRIKGKVEQSRKGVAPSPTHWCSSYRKGSLRVTLDYGRQLYILLMLNGVVRNKAVLTCKLRTYAELNCLK